MKSTIFYTSLIVIFLVSSLSFGDILPAGSSSSPGWAVCEISATASGSTTYDSDSYSEWAGYYTDTAGTFSWEYDICDHVDGSIYGWDSGESAYAMAYSESSVSCPKSNSSSAYRYLDDENGYFAYGPGTKSDSGTDYFEAYNGIWVDVGGLVVASIEEGSGAQAYSRTYSNGNCSMD